MAKKFIANDDLDIEAIFRNATPGALTSNDTPSESVRLSESDRLKKIRARFSEAMDDGGSDSPADAEANKLHPDNDNPTIMAIMESSPRQVVSCPPIKTASRESASNANRREKSIQQFPAKGAKDEPIRQTKPVIVTETADAAEMIIVNQTAATVDMTETASRSSPSDTEATAPRTTRISGKMRRASRDEFCGIFTRKVDTKGGSPITIAPDILKTAYLICAKSGNYRSCPTYVINNILRAVFDDMEAEIKSWPMPE